MTFRGRGDPRRVLALLWRARPEPTRGPRPSMTLEQILAAAIEIADTEGLAAVTMRRVAERLGVGAMSLYTYVPSKAELLDLMLDEVYGEALATAHPRGDWRQQLEAHARTDWDMIRRHPWILQVSDVRSLLGPNELALYDAALQAVSGIGLSGREMVSVVSTVASFVRGSAQIAIDAARVTEQTGVTDADWWKTLEPELNHYFDPTRYPAIAHVDSQGGFDPLDPNDEYYLQLAVENFEFGLQRVLDGIAAYVERKYG